MSFFQPGDFEPIVGYHNEQADKIAELANKKLKLEAREKALRESIDYWKKRWEQERKLTQLWVLKRDLLRDLLTNLVTEVGKAEHWLKHTEAFNAARAALEGK